MTRGITYWLLITDYWLSKLIMIQIGKQKVFQHTVEVLEPSVIFEAKDGKYGEDGSETIWFTDHELNELNEYSR